MKKFRPRNRIADTWNEVMVQVFESNSEVHMGGHPIMTYTNGVSSEQDVDDAIKAAIRHTYDDHPELKDASLGYKVWQRIS